MLKRFYSLTLVLFASIMMAWADSETTYYPTQEVCFRTGSGNTAWNSGYPKDATDEGNTTFEGNYQAGLFTLQKYKVDNLSDVTSIVLTLTAGSGVDATRVWLFPTNNWSASSSIDDMVNYVTQVVGFAPRSSEGTANAYLADGVKVAGSDPIKATLTISGAALATLKAGAAEDGTFTLMITDKSLITSSSRKFLSSNTANAEANRPTLVAKIETPAVTNQETGVGYTTLADAISDAGATATLLINKDVEITARQEITSKSITFKGNGGSIKRGSSYKAICFLPKDADAVLTFDGVTLDGQNVAAENLFIEASAGQVVLKDLTVQNMTSTHKQGSIVALKNSGKATFDGVTIKNCSLTGDNAALGIIFAGNNNLVLKGNNTFTDCTTNIYIEKQLTLTGTDATHTSAINLIVDATRTAGTLVKGGKLAQYTVTGAAAGLELAQNGNDVALIVPATPTAKIGETTYADMVTALAAVADGSEATITLLDNQELSSRVNIKNKTITITGGKTIKRASSFSSDMAFLTQKADEGYTSSLTFDGVTLDGNNVDTDKALIEASNGGTTILKDVTVQNCINTADAIIVNKGNGKLTLNGVTFTNCTPSNAPVFVGTNSVTLAGNNSVSSIYVEKNNVLTGTDATHTTAINLIVENTREAGTLVKGGKLAQYTVTGAATGLELVQSGSDVALVVPVAPTAKIGDTTYADLVTALAAAQDGDNIVLLDDQEVSSRLNIKNISVTISGGKTIKRATSYTDALLFLTQKADEGKTTALTLDGVTIDGQSVETTAALIEASNNASTTLKDVTIQNVVTSADAVVVNKSGGKLTLNGVKFNGCRAAKAEVFQGYFVTLAGANTISSILVEKNLALVVNSGATAASAIQLITDAERTYGLIVEGGEAAMFTCASYRLSQQMDGVYVMPLAVAGSYTHPALLHTSADIAAVKAKLEANDALATAAYSRLEAQSGGQAAGAVEYLKRMDKGNWESKYSDYSNFSRAATDAKLAYELALRYQLKGSTASATAAVNILNNWATTNKGFLRLKGYNNNIPDPNEYLMTIQAYQFANAAELLRNYSGWSAESQTTFKNWIRQTFADVAILFLENHHGASDLHYWLNWDLAAQNAMLSIGILCDDKALVDYALNYVDNGKGTGNKANAIVATHNDPDSEETLAQCQESGRDQGHSTLDVTLLGVLCQTAQNIGTDLWTSYKALEMAEYVGKYNLMDVTSGNFVYTADKVPFTTYTNGEETHTAISADDRGTVRPSWELFHAYAKKNSKADAYTEAWVKYQREKNAWGEAEGTSTDELGFGTLMYGAEITYSAITVTVKNASRQYGETNPAFEYEISGGTAEQLGGTIELTCEATATSGVGEYAIKAAKGTATYPNIVFVDGKLTITKAALTISGGTYSMKQGDALPEFKAVYEGFKNDETEEVLTKKPTLATTATSSSAPGEYEVTVSGAEAANYEMTYKAGKLVITNADAITVTVKNASRQYGEANPAFEYEISGGTAEQLGGTIELTCEATATSGVGEYAIKAAKGTATYPNIVFVDGKLTITKAPLTITAKSYMMKQGDALPEFEAEYAGFKNDETASVLSAQPTITTTATSASEPGTYDIVVSEASAANYDITYVKGTLTISAVEVTPVAETETTTFSETVNESTDLSNTIIDNTYFTMNAENGDGYDATEQAIVLNSTTTTEQMNTVQNAQVGDATMQTNYNGIIFEVPAGSGTVMVDAKTLGTHVLNVQIGSGEPTKIVKSERGTEDVNYSVASPTYVYLYASSSAASGAPRRAAASNSVLLYSYKVTVTVNGIEMVTYGDLEDAKWYTMDGRQLPGKPTKKGLYIVNGRKIIIK